MISADNIEQYERLLALQTSVRTTGVSGMNEASTLRLNERKIPLMSAQLERILCGEMKLYIPTASVRSEGTGLCEAG